MSRLNGMRYIRKYAYSSKIATKTYSSRFEPYERMFCNKMQPYLESYGSVAGGIVLKWRSNRISL